MINILYISNQYVRCNGVGNPVVLSMIYSLKKQMNLNEIIDFIPFKFNLECVTQMLKARNKYDIVHIHFGGLYALFIYLFFMCSKSKILVTFHGTDLHAQSIATTSKLLIKLKIKLNQYSSFILLMLVDRAGFVSESLKKYIPSYLTNKFSNIFFIHRLGVDYDAFLPISKEKARSNLQLFQKIKYALFSDISGTMIKRKDLAEAIIKELGPEYQLLVMSNVSKQMVPDYICSADFLLITSDSEGSPNIVRECLALNCPVFSFDVGDVSSQILGLNNSSIIPRNAKLASEIIEIKLSQPIEYSRDSVKDKIDVSKTSRLLLKFYYKILNEK